jgi:hypothetical protein
MARACWSEDRPSSSLPGQAQVLAGTRTSESREPALLVAFSQFLSDFVREIPSVHPHGDSVDEFRQEQRAEPYP